VEPLLKQGAVVNARDEDDSTPLHDASAGGYVGIVRTLLAANADPKVTQLVCVSIVRDVVCVSA